MSTNFVKYFVSASNAVKIVFLKEAAIHFLKYTGKATGNKLDADVYAKLLDSNEIAKLRADGLMYFPTLLGTQDVFGKS